MNGTGSLLTRSSHLSGDEGWVPNGDANHNLFAIVTSKITDHRSIANIIVMKKVKILQELPKCDTETGSEQTLLEIWR